MSRPGRSELWGGRSPTLFPAIEVPLMCGALSYDGLGFSGFPGRMGWKIEKRPKEEWYKTRQLIRSDDSHATSEQKIAFLQAWLFFAFLCEIFTLTEILFNVRDFIVHCGSERFVSTRPLTLYIERWVLHAQTLTQESTAWQGTRLFAVLEELEDFAGHWTIETDSYTFAESQILLSLTTARNLIQIFMSPFYSGGQGWPLSKYFFPRSNLFEGSHRLMIENGRCRSEVAMIKRLGMGSAAVFLTSSLKRDRVRLAWAPVHTHCTERDCIASHLDSHNYPQVHVLQCCSCSSIEIEALQLASVLRKGRIPRIKLSSFGTVGQNIKLTVVDSGTYVAISHVWSHGLGNPDANALPECQLARLMELVTKLSMDGQQQMETVSLWIDTLCVPVNPALREDRISAIRAMGQTYSEASKVLVLDAELQAASATETPVELVLRVITSTWMRRLWTLQEGAVARQSLTDTLHFQFREGAVAHSWLQEQSTLYRVDRHSRTELDLYSNVFYQLKKRIPCLEMTTTPFSSLARLSWSMSYRATSKAADEPICVALLLGLPPDKILRHRAASQRMKEIYLMLGQVPANIIFSQTRYGAEYNHATKLDLYGFRWAPKSFLGELDSLAEPDTDQRLAICNEEGLHGTFCGFILDDIRHAVTTPFFIHESGTQLTYCIRELPLPEKSKWQESCRTIVQSGTQAALIFDDTIEKSLRVVLAAIETFKQGVPHVHCLCRAQNRSVLSAPEEVETRKSKIAAGTSEGSLATGRFLPASQDWCIT